MVTDADAKFTFLHQPSIDCPILVLDGYSGSIPENIGPFHPGLRKDVCNYSAAPIFQLDPALLPVTTAPTFSHPAALATLLLRQAQTSIQLDPLFQSTQLPLSPSTSTPPASTGPAITPSTFPASPSSPSPNTCSETINHQLRLSAAAWVYVSSTLLWSSPFLCELVQSQHVVAKHTVCVWCQTNSGCKRIAIQLCIRNQFSFVEISFADPQEEPYPILLIDLRNRLEQQRHWYSEIERGGSFQKWISKGRHSNEGILLVLLFVQGTSLSEFFNT